MHRPRHNPLRGWAAKLQVPRVGRPERGQPWALGRCPVGAYPDTTLTLHPNTDLWVKGSAKEQEFEMDIIQENSFIDFLTRHDERAWTRVLEKILPSVHPVDQTAVRIWFGFWPLKLAHVLNRSEDPEKTARDLLLYGKYQLAEVVDPSVSFLYGSRYWNDVKRAIVDSVQDPEPRGEDSLDEFIVQVARELSLRLDTKPSLLIGITAVGFMALQQIGWASFLQATENPMPIEPLAGTPEDRVRQRSLPQKKGLFNFLKGYAQRYIVTWDERRKDSVFEAIQGQDISSAAASDTSEHTSRDPRCVEGPVPVQCRSGACGFCWVGLLGGKDRVSEITPFEKTRLRIFGYQEPDQEGESHPPIRLACQARVNGDITIVVPPWNGYLNGRRDDPDEPRRPQGR